MHENRKSVKEKISNLHMRSAIDILIEKNCEAKIFGMKLAFKWNNKCVQVENTTVR